MSNVLQMVGVVSMQLCGVNVRQLYGDLYSPRESLFLDDYHVYPYIGVNQYPLIGYGYGTIPKAVDLLYSTVFSRTLDG